MVAHIRWKVALASLALVAIASPAQAAGAKDGPAKDAAVETGTASWYGAPHQGKRTASGERVDMNELSAAHPTLPFGTRLVVTNLRTGKSVRVRVNDRGPHHTGHIIDLSSKAAERIGLRQTGVAPVALRRG
jgi:rare lipoprotein A